MIADVPAIVRALVLTTGICSLPLLAAQQRAEVPSTSQKLNLDQILSKLEEHNAERASALQEVQGTRIYRMEYHGFPSDRDAEMVVKADFHAPDSKKFVVVSETGSRFVIDHVFKKLLESEQEAFTAENRRSMALNRDNYDFELAGFEPAPDGGRYVLKLAPKTKSKFLYRGTVWVDATDFAVVRIQGEPVKNPSMWIKKTEIAHTYKKVEDFWLPAENRTESFIRMGGKATLSIKYQDYKVTRSAPVSAKTSGTPNARRRQALAGAEPAVWASHITIIGTP